MGIFFVVIGLFLSLFNYWRYLKEDYVGNQIFGSASIIFMPLGIMYLGSRFIYREYWFLVFLVLTTAALFLSSWRFKIKTFDILDSIIPSFLIFGFLVFLGKNIFGFPKIEYLIIEASFIFLYALYVFFSKRYTNISWYKSGKVGFAGLFTLAVFFLLKCVLAALFDDVVLFGQLRDIVFSGILAFVSFLVIFLRAKKLN